MNILTDDEVKLLMKPRWADWSREGCDAYDAIRNSHETLGKALAEQRAIADARYRLAYGQVDVVVRMGVDGRAVEEILRIHGDVPAGATNLVSLVEGILRQRDDAREELFRLRGEVAAAKERSAPEIH